jgi:hypothetical protein
VTIRILRPPIWLFRRSWDYVRRQVRLSNLELSLDRTNRLEVDEHIRHEPSFQRERTTMNNRVRFIENEVAGQHCYIVRFSIMSNYFQRPRFINVLIDVDNRRAHKGKTVHVGSQNCTFLVYTNAI